VRERTTRGSEVPRIGKSSGPDAAPDPVSERAERDEEVLTRPEVRWGVGCLVAVAAMVGVLALVVLVALVLQPPAWVQVVMGVGMAAGAVMLAWVVAAALGRRGR
jgi:hypothetical protein